MTRSVFNHRRGVGSGILLSADSFDRTDSTTLGNTDGDGILDPLTWVERNGDFEIFGNEIRYVSLGGGAARGVATVDLGRSDADVRVELASVGDNGIPFRFLDTSNWWAARTAGSDLVLTKREAGVNTTMATATAVASLGDILQVIAYGTDIRCYINGVQHIAITHSFNLTETEFGLYFNQATAAVLDNWAAYSV